MNKVLLSLIMLFSILLYSCVDDDVCDKLTTPRVTFSFKDTANTDGYKVDSLIVVRLNSDNSLHKEGEFYSVDSISIPMNVSSNKTIFYFYKGKEKDENKDIVTINHETQQVFVSKECGFKVNYYNVNYTLTQPSKKIHSITPVTTDKEITNESKNLYITYY